jgi:regulator of sigma E protease
MFSLIVFILILSFLVIIHELGHFLTARKFGMKVEEFGMGYPPKVKTFHTDKHGTEYTLNWLPFGGFVRLYGEDGQASVDKKELEGAFFNKPAWQRLVVILTGAGVNFLFGILAFAFIYAYYQVVPSYFWAAKITQVQPETPAYEAGLMVGDEIVYLKSESGARRVLTSADLIGNLGRFAGTEVTLVMRNGESKQVYVRKADEIPEGQGATGIEISDREEIQVDGIMASVLGAKAGVIEAGLFSRMLLLSLKDMVTDGVTMGRAPSEVAGPIGIVHTVQKEGILQDGFLAILNFAAILSMNLAIINVLPFPALDGGRATIIIIEMLTRKKVSPDVERVLNTVGFMLLLALIIAVSVRDVRNVIVDTNLLDRFSR